MMDVQLPRGALLPLGRSLHAFVFTVFESICGLITETKKGTRSTNMLSGTVKTYVIYIVS
jgi:hypothetical protein